MKLTPENVKYLLPEGYRMKVRHYHQGNDPDGAMRRGLSPVTNVTRTPPYASIAKITVKNGSNINVVASGSTVCNPKDQPSSSEGWNQAAQAAVQDYLRGCLIREGVARMKKRQEAATQYVDPKKIPKVDELPE